MAVFRTERGQSSIGSSTPGEWMFSPLALILLSTALICLGTRVRTGLLNKQQSVSKAEPKEIALLPYWLPWLGHALQFGTRFQDFLADARSLSLLCPDVLVGVKAMLTTSQQDYQRWSLPSHSRRHSPQRCHSPKRDQGDISAKVKHLHERAHLPDHGKIIR
jgi:hypothetical protein